MPGATDTPSAIVRVDVALPSDGGVIDVGLKVPMAPAGNPETVRATSELKPFRDATVMSDVPEVPCTVVRELGDADIEKSGVIGIGAAMTVRAMVTL